jgi:predicted lipid-binding transport protein (Tim44 family)
MIRSGSPLLPIVVTETNKTMTAVNYPGRRRGTSTGEIFMRALISALAVAGLVAIALPSYAGDVTTDPAKAAAKPGRAIDEPVTSDPAKAAAKPGRAADDSGKQDVKTGTPPKYGRAADDTKPATTSKKKKKKTTTPAPTN